MTDFVPVPVARGGHRMTFWAGLRRREFPALPAARRSALRRRTRLARARPLSLAARGRSNIRRCVILHGLEGSAGAHYVRGVADKAWRRGFNVVRLNQRNCGHTEHLSPTLYHSGLTSDPKAVLEELAGRDGLPRHWRGGLLARRQPRTEAGRRARRSPTPLASERSSASRPPSTCSDASRRSNAAPTGCTS